MPVEDVAVILHNFKHFGVAHIRLDGGEPFLYGEEALFKIIELAHSLDMKVGIFTNASTINGRLASRIKQTAGLELIVTLHCLNQPNQIRSTLAGLRALAAQEVYPELVMIVSRRHIPAMRTVLAQLPFHTYRVTFRPLIAVGKAYANWDDGFESINAQDWAHFLATYSELQQAFSHLEFVNAVPNPQEEMQDYGYHKSQEGFILHIDTDGNLLASFSAIADTRLGSALDPASVMEKCQAPETASFLLNADKAMLERISATEKPASNSLVIP
jgi:MoaA/NifB/PqqE/SkfB family radical SAM enzyme